MSISWNISISMSISWDTSTYKHEYKLEYKYEHEYECEPTWWRAAFRRRSGTRQRLARVCVWGTGRGSITRIEQKTNTCRWGIFGAKWQTSAGNLPLSWNGMMRAQKQKSKIFLFFFYFYFRPSLHKIEHVWAEEQYQGNKHILFLVLKKLYSEDNDIILIYAP